MESTITESDSTGEVEDTASSEATGGVAVEPEAASDGAEEAAGEAVGAPEEAEETAEERGRRWTWNADPLVQLAAVWVCLLSQVICIAWCTSQLHLAPEPYLPLPQNCGTVDQ